MIYPLVSEHKGPFTDDKHDDLPIRIDGDTYSRYVKLPKGS